MKHKMLQNPGNLSLGNDSRKNFFSKGSVIKATEEDSTVKYFVFDIGFSWRRNDECERGILKFDVNLFFTWEKPALQGRTKATFLSLEKK